MGYVIDSNAVIDYLGGQMPEAGMLFMDNIVNDVPAISIMTEIEVLGFDNPPEVYSLLRDFISSSLVVALNDQIVKTTIEIRKQHKIKTPDAIIAATALVLGNTLITRNVNDFKKIGSIQIVDPWSA